jgi:hypothetical protein
MGAVVLRRPRLSRPAACVSAAGLSLTLGLAACSGTGKKAAPPTTDKKVDAKVAMVKTATLRIGSVDPESAGPDIRVQAVTASQVLSAAQKYLDAAIHAPLKTGRVGADYAALFDPALRATATRSDAAALTDAVVGKVGSFTESAQPVALSVLADTNGHFIYAATKFNLTENIPTGAGRLNVGHSIELTFEPAGNHWQIAAYRVVTSRVVKGHTTTTTAKSGGSTAP